MSDADELSAVDDEHGSRPEGFELSRILDGAGPAVAYSDWLQSRGERTVHPRGFSIFMDRDFASEMDEYAGGDPYADPDNAGPTPFWRWRQSVLQRVIAEECPGTGRLILDLGCGTAEMTREVARYYAAHDFVGLDASCTAIEAAVRDGLPSNLQVCVADAMRPPFGERRFDGIAMMNLWEHVPAPIALAQSSLNLLVPRGWLLVATPSRLRTENLIRVARGRPVALRSTQHVTEYTVGQVCEQLRWAGFDSITVLDEAMPPIGPLARARRATLGAVLSGWRRVTQSHHAFGPTAFVLARRPPS